LTRQEPEDGELPECQRNSDRWTQGHGHQKVGGHGRENMADKSESLAAGEQRGAPSWQFARHLLDQRHEHSCRDLADGEGIENSILTDPLRTAAYGPPLPTNLFSPLICMVGPSLFICQSFNPTSVRNSPSVKSARRSSKARGRPGCVMAKLTRGMSAWFSHGQPGPASTGTTPCRIHNIGPIVFKLFDWQSVHLQVVAFFFSQLIIPVVVGN
jgi:hypothetical protein